VATCGTATADLNGTMGRPMVKNVTGKGCVRRR
jgi:hypothetical protein